MTVMMRGVRREPYFKIYAGKRNCVRSTVFVLFKVLLLTTKCRLVASIQICKTQVVLKLYLRTTLQVATYFSPQGNILKPQKKKLLQGSILEGHQVYHIASHVCVLKPTLKCIILHKIYI
jgi:hypothetical protein